MLSSSIFHVFQGIETLLLSEPKMAIARIGLIFFGMLLIYLGKRGILEPLLMIPMGLGMSTINSAVMFFDPYNLHHGLGSLFVDSALSNTDQLMTMLQIDFLQPIYTFTFSNGLIACLIFMGIGTLLDVGFIMARPFTSMFLALCAEFGTIITLPIAHLFGLSIKQSAAVATIGGADGPMVLFASLKLCPELFVPITVVAYLYLGFAYGGYPYLIKLLIPAKLRGISMPSAMHKNFSSGEKMAFAVIACVIMSLLFPVAAPLFFSLFLGIIVRESGLNQFYDLISNDVLYLSTFFLGLLLGILCDANTIFSPEVLPLLILGILALLLSGIGGIAGGYILWFFSKGKYNPLIGIAGVSCVPTTAKVAQKCAQEVNPNAMIMPYALGANVCGVITTAIIAALYVSLLGG